MSSKQEDSAYAAAFNLGSDARYHGFSASACPYPKGEKYLRAAWQAGYHDCDKWWGRDAVRPVRRLPPVAG